MDVHIHMRVRVILDLTLYRYYRTGPDTSQEKKVGITVEVLCILRFRYDFRYISCV